MNPYRKGLCEAPCRRGFVRTCTYRSYFPTDTWCFPRGAFRSPETPIERRLCIGPLQSPSIEGALYTHTYRYTHIVVFFPKDMGGVSLERIRKAPVERRLCIGAL